MCGVHHPSEAGGPGLGPQISLLVMCRCTDCGSYRRFLLKPAISEEEPSTLYHLQLLILKDTYRGQLSNLTNIM